MIKLFRNKRKAIVKQGKTQAYIKYALGEIVLVVIGILIALKISNWNESIQIKKEEVKTLNSLSEELKGNLSEFDSIFNAQLIRNESLQTVLFIDIKNQPISYLDSLITNNVESYSYNPSTGIYNSMINSGKIELISNDELKKRVAKLNDEVKDYQEHEDEITEFTKAHLETYFIENFNIPPAVLSKLRARTKQEERVDMATYVKTFSSSEINSMYILLLKKMGRLIEEGQKLRKEYNGLTKALEAEIALNQK